MAYYYYKEYNKLELHYWLESNLHRMDAIVQNRCEREFLDLINELAMVFDVELLIETEPLKEGGLKRFYNIISKEENKKAVITASLVSSMVIAIIVTPISTSIAKITEIAIERLFEDKKSKAIEDFKTQLEIEKLKQEIKINTILIENNVILEQKRGNFYKQLKRSKIVEKVSLSMFDERQVELIEEVVVERSKFSDYQNLILKEEGLKSVREQVVELKSSSANEIKHAKIEILSPVFSPSSENWKGIYNSNTITFKMNSPEFDKFVQNGNVQFKKGTEIICDLKIKSFRGRIKYEVINVKEILN